MEIDEIEDALRARAKKLLIATQNDYKSTSVKGEDGEICHYTDLNGLLGILDNTTVWATHAMYLNDPHEFEYGKKLIAKAIGDIKTDSDTVLRQFSDVCMENFFDSNFVVMTDKSQYYLSFSNKKDDLSQYRAYSNQGAGYCLVFDWDELKASLKGDGLEGTFSLIHIIYDEKKALEVLREIIDASIQFLKTSQISQEDKEQQLVSAVHVAQVTSRLLRIAASRFKQSGFHDEAEIRLMPNPSTEEFQLLPQIEPLEKFRNREGILIPYLEIPVKSSPKSHRACLKQIIIGPKLPFHKAELSLIKYLEKLGSENATKFEIEILRSATELQ